MDEWNSLIWSHSNVHQYHPFIVEIHSTKKVLQKWLQKHAMYMKNQKRKSKEQIKEMNCFVFQ